MIRSKQKQFYGPPDPVPNLSLLPLPRRPPLLPSDHLLHPRMPSRPSGPSPPSHIVKPGSSSSQGLLGPYPVMPQAMVMQRMAGMQAGGGKRFPPPFLPPGVKGQSLLGPAPIGAPLRNPHMGFMTGHQLRPHGHYMNTRGSFNTQRKRGNGHIAVVKANGEISKADVKMTTAEKKPEAPEAEGHTLTSEQTEPPVKKHKNPGAETLDEDSRSGDEEQEQKSTEDESPSAEADEDLEQSRTAEVQGVGTSLKVTIQHSSESRAFSTGMEETGTGMDKEKGTSAGKFCCYICNVSCTDQQDFQTHMISLEHQQKLMEIQHLSNTCLASLIPKMQQTLQSTHRDKKQDLQRWCDVCQCHFTGDLIEHRRTKKHKMAKVSSRPFCTVCERHFRTPRKFVEHMKSPEHKQRVEELREEGGPEVMEELITLDAIGCFEGEDDYEEEENENEEDDLVSEQVVTEEMNDDEEYDPDTQYGTSFVVPAAGFLCKLCHKFYHYESRARETHCKSLMHYQNLQKYRAMLNLSQDDEENVASSSDVVQNVENGSDCTEETEQKCNEEENPKSESDPVKNPPSPGQEEHFQSSQNDASSSQSPESSTTKSPAVVGKSSKKTSDCGSSAERKSSLRNANKTSETL